MVMTNIAVGLVIAGILSLALGKIIGDKKKGKGHCGCSSCPVSGQCDCSR